MLSVAHLHHLSGRLQFTEAADDNVGRHPADAQHAALGAPGQELNGERVFVPHVAAGLVVPGPVSVKRLGCFQLIENLEHYCANTGPNSNSGQKLSARIRQSN